MPPPSKEGTCNLVGRVVFEKIFSGLSLKMNIGRLIRPLRGFTFRHLGENKFVLRFNHKLDCGLALEGSPWLVDRYAMLLQPSEDSLDPARVEVNLMTIVFTTCHPT